jgi:hypothetical protein
MKKHVVQKLSKNRPKANFFFRYGTRLDGLDRKVTLRATCARPPRHHASSQPARAPPLDDAFHRHTTLYSAGRARRERDGERAVGQRLDGGPLAVRCAAPAAVGGYRQRTSAPTTAASAGDAVWAHSRAISTMLSTSSLIIAMGC